MIQPTIAPLFNTRQAEVSLLKWADSNTVNLKAESPYYDYLRHVWLNSYLLNDSWDQALHNGVFVEESTTESGAVSIPAIDLSNLKVIQPVNAENEIEFLKL